MTNDHTKLRLEYEVTPLTAGATNSGMAVHSLRKGTQTIVELVEKRTRLAHEGKFYEENYSIIENSPLNVPRLYKLQREKSEWSIFTEKIGGAMYRPKLDRHAADLLGAYLAEISLLKLENLKTHTLSRSLTVDDVLAAEESCETDEERSLCREIGKCLPFIRNKLSFMPLAPSHNDLNWNNMAVPEERYCSSPYIFDWERISLNCVGADLHFFSEEISRQQNKDVEQAFFTGYANRINASHIHECNLNPDDIMLSALSFGLSVRARWVRRYDALKHSPVTKRVALRLAQHLRNISERGEP